MRRAPKIFSSLHWRLFLRKRSQQLVSRRPRLVVPRLEPLEDRVTPTGNIAITNVSVVDGSANPLSVVNVGERVYLRADFTTQDLPSNASYRVAFTVNGLTMDTGNLDWGAGVSGTKNWSADWGFFIATPGTNQVSATVDPDHSVPESSYADNTLNSTFNAVAPVVGGLSYNVAQIRSAYHINDIANFGSAPADGSGQTIALPETGNDPYILNDLDSFDKAMSLTTNSNETIYQQYGAASSLLSVYNQSGTNITADIANSGSDGVPDEDPTGQSEKEETMDVEWAHAIAPGAKIDVIEVNDKASLVAGAALAASLPGVSVVSNSWSYYEWSGETTYDSSVFVTPSGHTGVTFLASSGDSGANVYVAYGPSVATDGFYPATSPNVVSVGGTELTLNNNAYGSEIAWGYPTPTTTIDNGSSSYSQTGSWTSQTGGFSGSYSTAAGGSANSAVWTIPITPANTLPWGTEVSATWTANPGNATNATYTIYDGAGTSGTVLGIIPIDQTKAPAGTADGNYQFQELGVFSPTVNASGDGTLTVVLNADSANGAVVADAIGATPFWASTGGPSLIEKEPSYQLPFQSSGYRTTPDVSFDASEYSGVTDYYTPFNNPDNAGLSHGNMGTSLSCPCWSGLIAIANQGRVALGAPTLNSTANPMQTLQALYSLPAGDFNDITTGYNGFSAGAGYDFVTGRGSPIANLLIPDLVRYGVPTVTALSPTSGPDGGGTKVTITGTNFTPDSSVHFGATAATNVTVNSDTSITAVAPAGPAGLVDVTVTTADGASATSSADQFTYTVAPSITTQPANQSVVASVTATFTAAASGYPGPAVQWQVSSDGGKTFSNVSGATNTTLTLSNVAVAMNGYEYQAVFTNGAGTATTNAAILTVTPAQVTTTAVNATIVHSSSAQTVTLRANLANASLPSNPVDEGSITFTVLNGASVIGTPVQGNVSSSTASAAFTVPAGLAAGSYTLAVRYSDSQGNFNDDGDTNGTFSVLAAPNVTTTAVNAAVVYNSNSQTVTFRANLANASAPGNPVDEGSVTFTVLNGATVIGTPVQGDVSSSTASAAFTVPAGLAAGSYTLAVRYSDSQGNFIDNGDTNGTLSVLIAPAVTTDPKDTTVTLGDTATFTAAASGYPPPTVQWQISIDGGSNFTDIPGATSPTLTVNATQPSQNGYEYQAVFTNSGGTATTTAATLQVLFAPALTTQPSNQTATAGQTATFTVAVNGNPTPTVQWEVSSDGGTTWTDIKDATSLALTLLNVPFSQNGDEYRAVLSNSLGSVTTTAALLSVQVPAIITSGNSAAFTAGQGGSFTVMATGSPTPTLTESGVLPGGVTFTDNGNGTATLAGTPAVGTQGTYHFTVAAHNDAGSDFRQSFTLTVNPAPVSPPPAPPPSHHQPPAPNVPPLLALLGGFFAQVETINGDGTETVAYSLFGTTLIVADYDGSGNFVSASLFGLTVPNWIWNL